MKQPIQRGFTLIELIVVIAVLGIMAAIFAPTVLGSKDGANAQLMIKTSQSVANNWMLIAQSCGTTTDATASAVLGASKTVGDVVFAGVSNVAAAYQTCYNQAKVIPMTDVGQPKSGGGYTVAGYTVTFSGGGTSPLSTAYASVPDALALLIAQKYTPSLTALSSSDTTSPVVQYGAATSGVRTVTILRPIL